MVVLLTVAGVAIAILGIVVTFWLSPNFRPDHKKYKMLNTNELDILKAMTVHRVSRIKPHLGEGAKHISLEPYISNRIFVRVSHLGVSNPQYGFALDRLSQLQIIRCADEQDYKLTGTGEVFLTKFSKRLKKHEYSGSFEDRVHCEKVRRRSRNELLGTVHTRVGISQLGTDVYSHVIELPPSEQRKGVVALIFVGGHGLNVEVGMEISIRTREEPFYLRLHETHSAITNLAHGSDDQLFWATVRILMVCEREDGTTLLYAGR